MDVNLQQLSDSLCLVSEQYHAVTDNARFDYYSWSEKVALLSPIVRQLSEQAKCRIDVCEKEIKSNNENQIAALDRRSTLYDQLTTQKNKLSELDAERVKIVVEIGLLSKQIEKNENEIRTLQERIASAQKENEYWNTVFLATCWLPFVNIGTGVKKHVEDGEYYAKANVLGKEINMQRERISFLNGELKSVCDKQAKNKESSGAFANQITMVEGEIAAVTTLINDLKNEQKMWQTILTACSEIAMYLAYANDKIETVIQCFQRLLEVEKLLVLPTTDRFIKGCRCKGKALTINQKLMQNEYLLSDNRRFVAVMQSNNDFVVYCSEKPIWASNTNDAQGEGYIELNEDGLVTMQGNNRTWNTKRSGAVELVMQNDGNLVAYNENNRPLWATDTFTYANTPGKYFQQEENI